MYKYVENQIIKLFHFPHIVGHVENAKLFWLVRLRWMAIGLFFLLAGPGYILGALSRTALIIYLTILGFLILFNLLTYLIFIDRQHPISPFFIGFQLAFDISILTGLIFISGGFGNPFVALFLLNAALGAILISGRRSWIFLFLCHTYLFGLQFDFVIKNLKMNSDYFWILAGSSHILLFSIWLVMRSLGTYLEGHFRQTAQAQITTEKLDRLRAIGALAAGFSHEFASPLNAAKICLDRLSRQFETDMSLQNSSDSQIKEIINDALGSLRSCEAVIQSMNSSQLDIRDYKLKPINMKNFIQDITESWIEMHPQAQIKIKNEIISELTLSPINLAQVIINLLDNAYESNPDGEIRFELKETPFEVELSIEDAGDGFDQHVLLKLGEPFLTTKSHGTGLGLYVSEIFVQSLGGRLSVKNKSESKGALVKLIWPHHKLNSGAH